MSTNLVIPLHLKPLLRQLDQDAMGALRACQTQYATLERTHHERICDMIGFIAAFVAQVRATPSDMRKFLRNEYWDGKPQEPKPKNVVRLATMYVIGAKESKGALYQQALTYAKVVDYFLSIGTTVTDIPAFLRRKKIDHLLDEINPPRDNDEPTAAEEPAERQTRAKGAKPDEAMRGSSREDKAEAPEDDEGEATDSEEYEAGPAGDAKNVDEAAPAANTISNDEDDDLLGGLPNPKEERREWERDTIKRARAIWKEGYEVLLVSMAKQPYDALMQLQGDGYVDLKCEYARSEDWQAIRCLHVRPN